MLQDVLPLLHQDTVKKDVLLFSFELVEHYQKILLYYRKQCVLKGDIPVQPISDLMGRFLYNFISRKYTYNLF